jgi:hypothetical protein
MATKKITLTVVAPKDLLKGEEFEYTYETTSATTKGTRGQLAGIALADMTDEQLKRELINANSVLYKAKQRGASAETVTANQTRVDAVKAEKALRTPEPTPVVPAAEGEVPADGENADGENADGESAYNVDQDAVYEI